MNETTVKDKYFFSSALIVTETNGVIDGEFDGPEYEVIGGSVVVSGTGPTSYILNYNFKVEGGRTLTGTYNGSFIYRID